MPQLSSYMQYYSMVRYFTHHSSLKGVKIQSLNLLYGVYIVCLPNNIHHWDHFDTHIVNKRGWLDKRIKLNILLIKRKQFDLQQY